MGALLRVGAVVFFSSLCVELLRVGAVLVVEVLRVGAVLVAELVVEPLRVGAVEVPLLIAGLVSLLSLFCDELLRVGAVLGAEPLRVGAVELLLLRVGAVVLPLPVCDEPLRVGADVDVPLVERVGADVAVPLCCCVAGGCVLLPPALLPVGVGRTPDELRGGAGCSILGFSTPGVHVLTGCGAGSCGARM